MNQFRPLSAKRLTLIDPRLGIWLSVLLLLAITWPAALSLAVRDGKDATARAERDTLNLSRTIAEQTLRAIADTDRILRFIAFDIARLGADDPRLGDILRNATSNSDLLLQLSFTNARGDLLQTSVEATAGNVNLADREHFLVHRGTPDAGLFISKPVFGRASGRWSIQLTRRITLSDGRFGGIVVASLDPFYFSRTFDTLDVGHTGVVAMIGYDGALRARTHLSPQNIGQDVSNSPLFAAATSQTAGFLRVVSMIDKVPRLVSHRAVGDYPLYIYAGFGEAEFMAETNRRRTQRVVTVDRRRQVRAAAAVLAPDGVLKAKVAGDLIALADAQKRRDQAVAAFAGAASAASRHSALESPSAKELTGLVEFALTNQEQRPSLFARMAAPLRSLLAATAGGIQPAWRRSALAFQAFITNEHTIGDDSRVRQMLLAMKQTLNTGLPSGEPGA